MPTKDEVLKEKELYSNTVIFFVAFSRHFENKEIKLKIEQEVLGEDGNPKIPDFIHIKNSDVVDIIEHKASLPKEEEYVINEVEETYKKYSSVSYNEKIYKPKVFLLCPKTCEKVINAIKEKCNKEIIIYIFNLDREEGEISFTLSSKLPEKSKLTNILDSDVIKFKLDDFSAYKFIRKEPPTIYTSWVLWSIVLSRFMDPYSLKKKSTPIQYENLISEISSLFPPWIRDHQQITRDRVNKALEFLNKIGFVNWKRGSPTLEYFHTRGVRAGEIFEYFAEKWVEKYKLKPKLTKKEDIEQESLGKFF